MIYSRNLSKDFQRDGLWGFGRVWSGLEGFGSGNSVKMEDRGFYSFLQFQPQI